MLTVLGAFELGWDTLVAVGTLGLAVFTASLARQTRDLARATADDERAQWRPIVIVGAEQDLHVVPTDGGGPEFVSFDVRNAGRGPAFALQAQMRSGKQSVGATSETRILAAGEEAVLTIRVSDTFHAEQRAAGRESLPAVLELILSYYDLAERWHSTVMTAVLRPDHRRRRISKVFVHETDRRLLPITGSPVATAKDQRSPWRRLWPRRRSNL